MHIGYRERQPSDPSVDVWRYLDLPRLISLLCRKELHLIRLDLLPDKFEATPPKLHRQLLSKGYEADIAAFRALGHESRLSPEWMTQQVLSGLKDMRSSVYASCWRFATGESEAMWRLYCPTGPGTAVTLPYQALKDSLKQETQRFGCVDYIDYDNIDQTTDPVSTNSTVLDIGMCKRKQFEHECEVRGLKIHGPGDAAPNTVGVRWDPEKFVERIIISPYAEPWHVDVIRDCIAKFAPSLIGKIQMSSMAVPPYW